MDFLATFVLCHDAWEGGWVWQETASALARAGHETYRPTFTGLGERRHLGHAGVDLDLHRQDVLQLLIYEDLQEVVLVGHGYGAMVATGVADDAPERIRLLVLLDPYLPRRGESFLDLFRGTLIAEQLVGEAKAYGEGWRIAPPLPPEDVRMSEQPLASLLQPLALRHPPRVRRRAVGCTGRGGAALYGPIDAALAALAQEGVPVQAIACGHRAPAEAPQELALLLEEMLVPAPGASPWGRAEEGD